MDGKSRLKINMNVAKIPIISIDNTALDNLLTNSVILHLNINKQ